jgi:hypothetical protein
MTPAIFEIVTASSGVTALLGTNPTRFWSFGAAPRTEAGVAPKPYAVWQLVYGSPENTLSCVPASDRFGVQVDAYARTAVQARAIARALRDALETSAYVVAYNGEDYEPDTELYRYGFTTEFMTDR